MKEDLEVEGLSKDIVFVPPPQKKRHPLIKEYYIRPQIGFHEAHSTFCTQIHALFF